MRFYAGLIVNVKTSFFINCSSYFSETWDFELESKWENLECFISFAQWLWSFQLFLYLKIALKCINFFHLFPQKVQQHICFMFQTKPRVGILSLIFTGLHLKSHSLKLSHPNIFVGFNILSYIIILAKCHPTRKKNNAKENVIKLSEVQQA